MQLPYASQLVLIQNIWDIMQKFSASQCMNVGAVLSAKIQLCSVTDPERRIEEGNINKFRDNVKDAMEVCHNLHLTQAFQLAMDIQAVLGNNAGLLTYRDLGARLECLRVLMENESRWTLCLTSYGGVQKYYEKQNLFGDTVYNAFPGARDDIREAGNCLAFDVDTAAVFHLMRAVEWALRAFAVHLGFRSLKIHKKSGAIKILPVPYAEWEKIVSEAQERVDKQINKMRPGKKKQEFQNFYYPALQEIRAIRDAWRNHTMHTRSFYNREDALAIYSHVERLMKTLASKISES